VEADTAKQTGEKGKDGMEGSSYNKNALKVF
jgi:hypothetical protein